MRRMCFIHIDIHNFLSALRSSLRCCCYFHSFYVCVCFCRLNFFVFFSFVQFLPTRPWCIWSAEIRFFSLIPVLLRSVKHACVCARERFQWIFLLLVAVVVNDHGDDDAVILVQLQFWLESILRNAIFSVLLLCVSCRICFISFRFLLWHLSHSFYTHSHTQSIHQALIAPVYHSLLLCCYGLALAMC